MVDADDGIEGNGPRDDASMQCTISEEMDNFQHYFLTIPLSRIIFYATMLPFISVIAVSSQTRLELGK